jgi:tetratricopeptide (TPR) repeat protein
MRRLAVVGSLVLAAWSVVDAQRTEVVRTRPTLPSTADTNDAEAYYRLGHEMVARKPGVAADAFYWATRLNPYGAHAFYGRYASLLLEDPRFLTRYLADDERLAESPERKRIDSLFMRALMLDPFLYRKYEHLVIREAFRHTVARSPDVVGVPQRPTLDRAFARWVERSPPAFRALVAYCEGRFADALRDYAASLPASREKAWVLSERGRIFYMIGDHDSALAELGKALEELRKRDSKDLVVTYASKALLEYTVGKIHERLGAVDEAREAYGRALQEDLAFHPAHVGLGILALQQGDTATALSELSVAVELRDGEPMLRLFYGYLLARLGRYAEAETQLTRAIELEPFYARSYQLLGDVYEAQQRLAEAIAQYDGYLARAALTDGPREEITRRRKTLVDQSGGKR